MTDLLLDLDARSRAKIADLLESLDSLYGGDLSDRRLRSRVLASELDLRNDDTLPEASRFELAALTAHFFRSEKPGRDGAKPAEWAEIAKGLIRDFPAQEGGYHGLLGAAIAESDPEAASGRAHELQSLSAPDWVRDRAAALLLRNDLVGLDVGLFIGDLWPEVADAAAKGKSLVIYTWTSNRTQELDQLLEMLDTLSIDDGPSFFGLCVDEDAAGRQWVRSFELPGENGFLDDPQFRLVASRLHADLPFLLYECDGLGIIRAVRPLHSSVR